MLLDYEIDSPFIILNCNDVFRNLSLEDDFRSLRFGARLLQYNPELFIHLLFRSPDHFRTGQLSLH